MKKINIHQFTKPDKTSHFIKKRMFSVYLGNSQFYYFKSQKATNLFLIKANLFFNDKYKHLNLLYGQIFIEYRKFYIFIDSPELDKQARKVVDYFKTFENCLELSTAMSCGQNANYFAISNLLKALRALIFASQQIVDFYKARNHYENIYGLNFIIEQLNIIDYQINTFGIKTEVNEEIVLFD